mmetsp:Transcript_29050/g.64997  ORF Transcript_29050/g.64997 Transcript_29050/m.64997 type:complete len:223 (-) Transcript_29050:51-719(-)
MVRAKSRASCARSNRLRAMDMHRAASVSSAAVRIRNSSKSATSSSQGLNPSTQPSPASAAALPAAGSSPNPWRGGGGVATSSDPSRASWLACWLPSCAAAASSRSCLAWVPTMCTWPKAEAAADQVSVSAGLKQNRPSTAATQVARSRTRWPGVWAARSWWERRRWIEAAPRIDPKLWTCSRENFLSASHTRSVASSIASAAAAAFPDAAFPAAEPSSTSNG